MKRLNHRIISILLLSVILLGVNTVCMSIPAYFKTIQKKQSTGKTITFSLLGDEHLHWGKTIDGYVLLSGGNGDMMYAILDAQGDMVASDVPASDTEQRSSEEIRFINTLNKDIFFSQRQLDNAKTFRNKKNEAIRKARTENNFSQRKINKDSQERRVRLLVMLVSFQDETFMQSNVAQFNSQITVSNYTRNGATGSVRDYFYDQSFSQMDPQFDVLGPYTLPYNQSYYGSDEENNGWKLVRDAVAVAENEDNIDFSVYDNNDDGYVDLIHIIYAGIGEHYSGDNSAVWAHMFFVPEDSVESNGTKFSIYACSSERNQMNQCDAIGAVCHEMGHAFGLPDMYDADYQGSGGSSVTPASWDVMAEGSYNNDGRTPPYYSMFERKMLGYASFDTVQSENVLEKLYLSNSGLYIPLAEREFFDAEYRVKHKWDDAIPAEGMVIFHINEAKIDNWMDSNLVNNNPNDRGYFIEPAVGGNFSSSAVASPSCTFPGSSNITSKSDFTLTDGTFADGEIQNIHYDDQDNIVFSYIYQNPVTFAIDATEKTSVSITIEGSFSSEETISNRKLLYKAVNESDYTEIAVNNDSFTQTIQDLQPATAYNFRLSADIDGTTYYSRTLKAATLCSAGAIESFPWSEDFEQGMECWTVEGDNDNVLWQHGNELSYQQRTLAEPYHGEQMALFTVGQEQLSSEQSSRLISPVFNTSNLRNPYLTFAHFQYSSSQNSLRLYYRQDENQAWRLLKTYTTNTSGWSLPQWEVDTVQLPRVSQRFQFCFVGQDRQGAGVAVDDITLDAENSSLQEVVAKKTDFRLGENPSSKDVCIYFEAQNDMQLRVTDVLGNVIGNFSVKRGQTSLKLPSSSWAKGVYLLKMYDTSSVCVKKFIKL